MDFHYYTIRPATNTPPVLLRLIRPKTQLNLFEFDYKMKSLIVTTEKYLVLYVNHFIRNWFVVKHSVYFISNVRNIFVPLRNFYISW